MRTISYLVLLMGALGMCEGEAFGLVEGTTPTRFESHRVFGDARAIGNTLMGNPWPDLAVNTVLRDESSANLSDVPTDAELKGAYLWWSGSLAPGQGAASVDDDALLTVADGASANVTADSSCKLITTFPAQPLSFYYCRADVSSFVAAHPGMFSWNGSYTVGDVYADPGHVDECYFGGDDPYCQAKYAAWTLILVYDSPSSTLQRDVMVYDGFVHADEVSGSDASLGIFSFTIADFLVGAPAEAEIAYFGLEGDAFLGAPDLCETCQDFFDVNGVHLHDGLNPWGNVYNSTPALGFDLDEFDIGTAGGGLGILDTGDTSAVITTGSGDLVLDRTLTDTAETVFLGWVMLRLNRPSPNFRGPVTRKTVDVSSATTGSTLYYSLTVANQGSQAASEVVLTDELPSGLRYQPGTITVDGRRCTDAADGDACTVAGSKITVDLGTIDFFSSPAADIDRSVAFRAVLTESEVGTMLCNTAGVVSLETPTAAQLGPACTTIEAATLGQPTKLAVDLTGGVTGPADLVQYRVTIPGDPINTVRGVSFSDDLPAHTSMLVFSSSSGEVIFEPPPQGAYQAGRLTVGNMTIEAGDSGLVTYSVQVASEAAFAAGGVLPDEIHGTRICNRGQANAGFLEAPLPTDDPATVATQDATCFAVSYAPLFGASLKQGVDQDGGLLKPGDTIAYTITLTNNGNRTGTVSLVDSMPEGVEGFSLLTPIVGSEFLPPPAGAYGTGRFSVSGLAVAAGATITIRFTVMVKADASDGLAIANQAALTVVERPEEDRTLESAPLLVVSRPDLSGLVKRVVDLNGGTVEPGDTLRYDLEVTNTGTRSALAAVMTDKASEYLTGLAVVDGPGVIDRPTNTITWTWATIAVGELVRASFTARVVAPLANGTPIRNQAVLNPGAPLPLVLSDDPATPAADDETVVVVISAPNLSSSTKRVLDYNGGPAEPGDRLRYSIRVTNSGSETASAVVVTDEIPVELGDLEVLDGGTLLGRTATWSLRALAPDRSTIVRFNAVIRQPLLDGTIISNQGSVTTPELPEVALTDDPTTAAAADPTILVVSSRAAFDLSVLEQSDLNGGAAQPGDAFRYTLVIRNNGNSPATNVIGTVVVDGRFAAVAAENGGVYDPAARTVSWTVPGPIDPVDSGAPEVRLSFVATLTEPLADGERVCERATVTSAQGGDSTTAEVCFTVTSRPDFAASEKVVLDVNGGEVVPGDALAYTLAITNNGTRDASRVAVIDRLDANLADIAPSDGGVYDRDSHVVAWLLPTVRAHSTALLRFTARVVLPLDDGTTIANQATINCSSGCPVDEPTDDPATAAADDPTEVSVRSPVLLRVNKSLRDDDEGKLEPGDAVTYTVTLSSEGTSCADNVAVGDRLVELFDPDSVVAEQNGVFDRSTSTLTWNQARTPELRRLCPGSSGTLDLVLHATLVSPLEDATPVCNQAWVTSDDVATQLLSDDPATPGAEDPTCRSVSAGADFSGAVKTVVDVNGPPVRPGDALVYTISFTNVGNTPAAGVRVRDPIDARLTSIVAGEGGVFAGGEIDWNETTNRTLATVAAGDTITLRFTAIVAKPLDDGTVVANQAEIVAASGLETSVLTDDPTTASILDDATAVQVAARIDLAVTKTVTDENGGAPGPGDSFLYTIDVVNNGDALARGVTIGDPLPASLELVESLDGGKYDAGARAISWNVEKVAPGEPLTVRFRARTATSLADGDLVSNQALVTASGIPEAVPSDDPATPEQRGDPTTIRIVALPDLSLSTKSVTGASPEGTVAPGTAIEYSIRVRNSGNGAANEIEVRDPVDRQYLEDVVPIGGELTPDGKYALFALAALPAGSERTLRLRATVRADVPHGALIANQAFITSAEVAAAVATDDPADPEDDDPTEVLADARPKLIVDKVVVDENGGLFAPGDRVLYTITVSVEGPAHAYDVAVSDRLPVALLDAVPNQGGRLADGAASWDAASTPALAHLEPGARVLLGISARIAPEAGDGDLVSNQASGSATGLAQPVLSDDPATPEVGDPTVLTVVARPILVAAKSVADENGGKVLPGDTLTYSIAVSNQGTASATGVMLFDPLPANTVYVKGSTRLNDVVVPDLPGGRPPAGTPPGLAIADPRTDKPATIEPGNDRTALLSWQVRVSADALLGTVVSNQAFVTASELSGTVSSDDPATSAPNDATAVVVGGGALLATTTKTYLPAPVEDSNDNGLFDPGEVIQFQIAIENSGDEAATGVVLTDPFGAGADYVKGSLRLDGRTLTDAPDGDEGSVVGGVLTVQLGDDLVPHQVVLVSFQLRIGEGAETITNQGTVVAGGLAAEPTDADGNDANGDQPTIVPVGKAVALSIAKSVVDLGGGKVSAGDELWYTLAVTNHGREKLASVEVLDELPAEVDYVPGSLAWPGSPAEPVSGDVLRIDAGMSIEAGETVLVSYRATIGGSGIAIEDGQSVCNTGEAWVGKGGRIRSGEACVVVGSVAGASRVTGRAFVEGRPADRKFQDDRDRALAGLVLKIWHDDDNGNGDGDDDDDGAHGVATEPVAAVTTGDDGEYEIDLPPGRYVVRAFSSEGVELARNPALSVAGGEVVGHDVVVDPSGVVYNATTGKPIGGVRVALYYDDSDSETPGEIVPDDKLGLGQQRQMTAAMGDAAGFYKFDVEPGRRYRLVLDSTGTTWSFPSQLLPPAEGFAPTGKVSPDAWPSIEAGADTTYYLKFDVAAAGDDVFNNHVPIDPLAAQIRLEKRADRPSASLADIVTYTITVQNRSARDLGGGEAVFVRDLPARGLSYLKGQAAAELAPPGSQKTRMRVGAGFAESIAVASGGQVVDWGPFDLTAGSTLTLTYQVVIGLETKQGIYRNRAVLLDAARQTEISNADEVALRVENDPVFDEGLLLGRVFCDDDGDGRLDRNERGVFGARVFSDLGSYAITDSAGKWHLSRIEPGVHLVKIDVASLPPGSVVAAESRIIFFSRGLAARVDFAVHCGGEMISSSAPELVVKRAPPPPGSEAKDDAKKPPAPPAPPPKTSVTITGDVQAMTAAVDGTVVSLPVASLTLEADPVLVLPSPDGSSPNLRPPGEHGFAVTRPAAGATTGATTGATDAVNLPNAIDGPGLSAQQRPIFHCHYQGVVDSAKSSTLQILRLGPDGETT
ncbi:MAG: hypothetical protein V2A73_12375, partial [Pseudomonadota bacterium]